jgi:FkbM family methyltransferase
MEVNAQSAKKTVKRWINRIGFDIVRYQPAVHPLARRLKILECYGINLVIDVGANAGQYAQELRRLGYKGRIVSFEPLSDAFQVLRKSAEADHAWDVYHFALGDKPGTSLINVSGNSYSSSLLGMLPKHLQSAPDSGYVRQENIIIKTLDDVFPSFYRNGDKCYLKIDTQGFEKQVLEGGPLALQKINTIQLEMSLVPLYDGETLFLDMCQFLKERGFEIVALEPGFADANSGQLLQIDGIFRRLQF